MTQAMACMYNTQKGPRQKLTGTKLTGGKLYLGKSKPSEITKGLDAQLTPVLHAVTVKILGINLVNVVSWSKISKENSWQQKA